MSVDTLPFKTNIAGRLHCAEGHVRGIAVMIEREDDCESVVHQLLAVQGALREVNRLLLQHHLDVCLKEQFQQSNIVFRERYMNEIVALYQQLAISAR